MNEAGPKLHGAIASFAGPEELLEGVRKVQAAGYRRYDAYSPFPIHGIDAAMGQKPSRLSRGVLIGGLLGATFAVGVMLHLNVGIYPINTGGKAYGAVEPLVPITFEMGVLLAAFTAVFGMILLNGLPRLHHPLFSHPDFARVSDDGFFVVIEASDPGFDAAKVQGFLREIGGQGVGLVEE